MARTALSDTLDAIYTAVSDPASWSSALEQVADYVGGSGAMIVHNNMAENSGAIISGRLRDDLGDLYVREYCCNPIVMAVAKKGAIGTPTLGSSLCDMEALRRTAFDADILNPQRIVDLILVPHMSLSQTGSSGGFGVTLMDRHKDDAKQAILRMEHLAPHLARAFDLSVEMAQQRMLSKRSELLLDMLPSAAVLLNVSGQIVKTNNMAEDLLLAGDAITMTPSRLLRAALAHEDRRLRSAITAALGSIDLLSTLQQGIAVGRHSGRPPVLLILTPLPASLMGIYPIVEQEARLLIQIVDPTDRFEPNTDALRQAFGLTAAEARVAALVSSGLTTPQAGQALGLSPATIRTQLASCFQKTGTHSQIALARLVMAITPGKRSITQIWNDFSPRVGLFDC